MKKKTNHDGLAYKIILSQRKEYNKNKIRPINMDAMVRVNIQNTEYKSLLTRNKFKNDSLKIKDFYNNRIGEIIKLQTTGYDNTNRPYSMDFETIYETEKLGDNIAIKPFLNLPLAKSRLTQKERTYPIDFIYPWENEFESTLEIPSGYFVSDLPEGYNHEDELAEISLNYYLDDSTLQIKGSYKFKKSIYVAKEYSRIKYYMDQIIKNFNHSIFIEK